MKTEWKVLVSLLALLLLMEVGVRAFETRLSKDLAHLRELPAAAERLKAGDGYKVLIVGNSLARYGIDRKLLAHGLEDKGYGKAQVEVFNPDATGITEWYYGLRRYFLNRGAFPDQIIVVTGRTHLLDVPAVPDRLGSFYVDNKDVIEAIIMDLRSVENAAQFLLARTSRLFANRARIQPYVFYTYLPGYTQTIQEINDLRKMRADVLREGARQGTTNLARFLQLSDETTLSVVAVPMFVPYDLPQVVSEEIEKQGTHLLDLSRLGGIDEKNFFDGYHLDTEGARRLTKELVNLLGSKDGFKPSKNPRLVD